MPEAKTVQWSSGLDQVGTAESRISELRTIRNIEEPGTVEYRQAELDLERAEAERETAVQGAVQGLIASNLISAYKNIAVAVVEADLRIPVQERRQLIEEGFDIYARVMHFFHHPGEVVIVRGVDREGKIDSSITLHRSSGVEDLKVGDVSAPGLQRNLGIRAVYTAGVRVEVNPVEEDSFPEIDVTTGHKTDDLWVFQGIRNLSDPLEQLKKSDPIRSRNKRVTFAGNREEARSLPELRSFDDQQRFALRMAAHMLGESDWLQVKAPSAIFSERLVSQFGDIFADVLCGIEPSDEVTHISGKYNSFMQRTDVRGHTMRAHGLANFTREELLAIFHGAGVSHEGIIMKTRATIDAMRAENTPRAIRAYMAAERDFHPFFALLFEGQ